MLKQSDVMATVASSDLARARSFYEGKLGLPLAQEEKHMLAFRSGASTLLVYESGFAGSNKANAATWALASGLPELVRSLQEKGIVFERYDLPNTEHDGPIHRQPGGRLAAWCKDPDGNVLCFAQG